MYADDALLYLFGVLSRGHAWDMCHQRNIGNYESTPRIRMICGAHLQEVWAEINIRQERVGRWYNVQILLQVWGRGIAILL